MAECSIAVFDLGGVLVDWDPRYLYRKLFAGDIEAMEEFLANGVYAIVERRAGRRSSICRCLRFTEAGSSE